MRLRSCISLIAAVFVLSGCEWDSTDSFQSWDDSYSWINFSGGFSGLGAGGYIVSQHGLAEVDPTTGQTIITVTGEDDGTRPELQTVLAGDFDKRGIVPGSVTIVMTGSLSSGTFTDDGGGGLSGTYTQVGADPPTAAAAGTVNYDTGIWTLQLLEAGGFLAPVTVTLNYAYAVEESGGDNGGVEPGPTMGAIYTFQIEQTGNRLTFTDSRGNRYTGVISTLTTGGGDSAGRTSGYIVANFEVTGPGGIRIVGSFEGTYSAPAAESEGTGNLTDRIIRGTWIEPSGHSATVLGEGGSVTIIVPVAVTP